MQDPSPSNADSLKLQLLTAPKKEWWPATADSLHQAVICQLWYTLRIEPTTTNFRLLVRRDNSQSAMKTAAPVEQNHCDKPFTHGWC